MKIAIMVLLGISLIGLFYYLTPEKDESVITEEKEYPNLELMNQKLNKSGLYIFNRLLETSPNVVSIEEVNNTIDTTLIETEGELPNVYMLVDNGIKMAKKEIDRLKEFVRNGNVAFVSVIDFGERFSKEFCYGDLTNKMWNEGVSLNFTHDTHNNLYYSYYFQRFQDGSTTYRDWNYFVYDNFKVGLDNIATLSLETYYENPVYVKVPHGEGYFYLHSIPEVFVNESMFTQDGFDYAQSVLSHLPKGHYKWHNYLNEWDIKNDVDPNDSGDIVKQSPIQYILKDPNLISAYLLAIFALLIYIFFKTKRKQKIIPTVEPNENSSLEFVETVSKLYLKQNKHYKFIKHYEQSFIHFIKDKYYISSQNIDKDYIDSIAMKSDISEERIQKIFKEFERAKTAYTYSSDDLIKLHKKIEYFYKHCK